jgi:hypothetical protein
VTALPGKRPRSPETIEAPVFVTVDPANTAKDWAVPSPTGGWADDAANDTSVPPKTVKTAAVPRSNTGAYHKRKWLERRSEFNVLLSFPA